MKILDEQYKEDMTNRIIKALEKGTAPWQKTWSNNLPINQVYHFPKPLLQLVNLSY